MVGCIEHAPATVSVAADPNGRFDAGLRLAPRASGHDSSRRIPAPSRCQNVIEGDRVASARLDSRPAIRVSSMARGPPRNSKEVTCPTP